MENNQTGEEIAVGVTGSIGNAQMIDANHNSTETPGGLRFVTTFSQSLYNAIDALSTTNVDGVPVEYGYVVGTEANIKAFTGQYNITEPTKYQLQYNGTNVNGVDTTGKTRTAETDYRYISNINCTSQVGNDGNTVENGVVALDHRNFTNYRLYTLVITYEGDSASRTGEKINARAYIRYYDANGKLRVFYNTYKKSMYNGCMCSFAQVASMAIPQDKDLLAEQQKDPNTP